jgi:hypothetical protein
MASLEMLKKLNCYFFSKFVIIVHYHNTFLGFVVIKLLLKMSNLRKLQGKEKYKIWWKPKSFLFQVSSKLEIKYPIIDNFFLSYNLVKH